MRFYISILLNLLFITIIKSSELDSIIKVDSNIYNGYIIDKIIITGNTITNNEVILRELSSKTGDYFNYFIYEEDISNLNNLSIFNRVDIKLLPNSELKKVDYHIILEESPNVLPIPQAGMKEGSIKKLWVGINFQWKNFRGYNETIGLNFGIGYEPFILLTYFNPWIGSKERFFMGVNFKFSKNILKILPDSLTNYNKDNALDYNLYNYSGGILIGKYLSKYFNFSVGLSYNINNISEFPKENSSISSHSENYTKIISAINYDKRNDVSFTTHGTYFDLIYSKIGFFSEKFKLDKLELNLKKFIPIRIKKDYFVSYSFWIKIANNFGERPPDYLLEVYGYNTYIRGWKDYIFKGENSFGIFTEFRIPVVKPFYVNGKNHIIIKSLPILSNFSYRYGLYLSTFFDIGTVYDRGVKISDFVFKKGYGLGINVILPFNFVFRLDFALNKEIKKLKSRFSFDLNSFF